MNSEKKEPLKISDMLRIPGGERKFTLPDAAAYVDMPLKTLYGYINRGLIPVHKITNGPRYILLKDLENEDFLFAVKFNKSKGGKSKSVR